MAKTYTEEEVKLREQVARLEGEKAALSKQLETIGKQPVDPKGTVFPMVKSPQVNEGNVVSLLLDGNVSEIEMARLAQNDPDTRQEISKRVFGLLASSAMRGDMRFAKPISDPSFKGSVDAVNNRIQGALPTK